MKRSSIILMRRRQRNELKARVVPPSTVLRENTATQKLATTVAGATARRDTFKARMLALFRIETKRSDSGHGYPFEIHSATVLRFGSLAR